MQHRLFDQRRGRGRWGEKLVEMAIDAVKRVHTVVDGRVEVDVKRYARVEKIPGGEMQDSKVSRS